MGQYAENRQDRKTRGVGRRTGNEIVKWNKMTALKFQTRGWGWGVRRHQTSPTSLRGEIWREKSACGKKWSYWGGGGGLKSGWLLISDSSVISLWSHFIITHFIYFYFIFFAVFFLLFCCWKFRRVCNHTFYWLSFYVVICLHVFTVRLPALHWV